MAAPTSEGWWAVAFLSRLATVCFVAAIPLLLVTTNVRFFAGEVRFYERGFREHDAEQVTGVPLAELDRSAQEIIDYFEDDSETLRILVTENGQEVSLFSARETEHMEDVKWLMQVVFRVNEISLAYVLTYVTAVFLWSGERSLRSLAWQGLAGVGVGAAAIGFIGVFAVTGFESTWERFHEIVFRNDLWQLDPDTDRLIQMFPEAFWEESTYLVGAMTIAQATAIVIVSVAYLVFGRTPTRRQPEPAASAGRGTAPRDTTPPADQLRG